MGSHAEQYDARKAAGLCPGCRSGAAPRPGKVLCARCAAARNAHTEKRYASRKAAGLCIKCGKSDAAPNRVKCRPCLAIADEQRTRWGKAHPEKVREAGRLRRIRAAATGLCSMCSYRPVLPNRKHCATCKALMTRWYLRQPQSKKQQRILLQYGISPEDFDRLMAAQDRACAICREPFVKDRPPQIDHCHATDVVRGLLCRPCNYGLGNFKDSIESLTRAIDYLNTREATTGEQRQC